MSPEKRKKKRSHMGAGRGLVPLGFKVGPPSPGPDVRPLRAGAGVLCGPSQSNTFKGSPGERVPEHRPETLNHERIPTRFPFCGDVSTGARAPAGRKLVFGSTKPSPSVHLPVGRQVCDLRAITVQDSKLVGVRRRIHGPQPTPAEGPRAVLITPEPVASQWLCDGSLAAQPHGPGAVSTRVA